MAAQFGHMDVISTLLLNSDSLAEIKDEGGWTAAQLAESEEQDEAQILLEDWASNNRQMLASLDRHLMHSRTATILTWYRQAMCTSLHS